MVVVEQYAGCGGINTPSGASGTSKQKVGGGEIGGAEKESPARGLGTGTSAEGYMMTTACTARILIIIAMAKRAE